ncbi:hypothetical protein L1987_87089 [Smallanthus sonchifolius]|nr:hypothetical protein L1987_87089 [Smallanthus sonchifolius]
MVSIGESDKYLLNRHKENHFTAGEVVRDIIIGVSDGLTVPFALAAGLSGANASSSIILTAGIAEVAAGAISMGLGGYLAAKSEADHYTRELCREQEEIDTIRIQAAEVAEILAEYGVEPHEYGPVVNALRKNPQAWLDFMMKIFEQTLLIFGFAKGYFTGNKPVWSALQTALIGAIASAAAFGMAKAVQGL